jgi:hypothetical protein
MFHALAEVIAWTFAVGITLGLLGLLGWLLRVLYRDSIGKPLLRGVMLVGLAVGGFMLWWGASITP